MSIQVRLCAFCGSERKLYLKKHAGWVDILTAVVMSLLVMMVRWQEFNPKSIAIFAAIVMTMEVIIQLRYRLNLTCQFCGFDPVIYKRSPEAAAQMVKKHLAAIRANPDFLLSRRAQNTLKKLKRVRRNQSSESENHPSP